MYYKIYVYCNNELIFISDKYESLDEANYLCKESARVFENCDGIDFKVHAFSV